MHIHHKALLAVGAGVLVGMFTRSFVAGLVNPILSPLKLGI